MSTGSARKPENDERNLPSASFSLHRWQVQKLRDESIRRGVSQSEIVRQALGVALRQGGDAPAAGGATATSRARRSDLAAAHSLVQELTSIRTELYLLRGLLGFQVHATVKLDVPPTDTDLVLAIMSVDQSLPCPSANDHDEETKGRARPLGYRSGP